MLIATACRAHPAAPLSILAGSLSGWCALAEVPRFELAAEVPYAVRIVKEPQRQRVGEVKMTLEILGIYPLPGAATSGVSRSARVLCRAADLPWKNVSSLQAGSAFVMRAQFRPLRYTLNPFSYDATLLRHGYSATCKIKYAAKIIGASHASMLSRMRSYLRRQVTDILGEGQRAGLVLAMSLGMRDTISEPTEEAFKTTGLAHLLVASGYQVTLLFCSVCWLLRGAAARLLSTRRSLHCRTLVAAGGFALIVLFVALVGAEGSVLRALFAVMFTIFGQLLDRGASFVNSILLSFLLVALVWPGCYFEPGIQLTFAALWGLAMADGGPSAIHRYLKACLLACAATSAVGLAWFGRISLWSFVLNPILAPFGSLVGCKAVLVALIIYLSGVDSSGVLLRGTADVLEYYAEVIESLAEIPYGAAQLDGALRWCVVAALIIFCAAITVSRIRAFMREYNLDEVRPRRLLRDAEDMHLF